MFRRWSSGWLPRHEAVIGNGPDRDDGNAGLLGAAVVVEAFTALAREALSELPRCWT